MSNTVLAAQLYTVREFTKTPEGVAETFKKVRQIGYKAVQISAFGPIDPQTGVTQGTVTVTYEFATVPVPPAVWLFVSALGLLGWMRRRTEIGRTMTD